jgi:hypothetical protein
VATVPTQPELSVVVPSVNGWGDLGGCLAALRADAREFSIEILVVDRVGETVRQPAREGFPDVTLIEVDRNTTIPEMRAIAIRRATAPRIAVIEDHVLVPAGWAHALVEAQRRHGGVVGGAVSNAATERHTDRAAFLCEYSHLLPPLPSGRAEWLTGNNTIYPRALLDANRTVIEAGRWEDHLHRELRRAGVPLTCCPEIVVAHNKHYTVGEYFIQRYYYARSFAGGRVAGRPLRARLAYGCGALLLPPLLFGRIIAGVWNRRTHRRELLPSLPLITLFVLAWSAGEATGYWFGPGDALSRVC